jgi:hypothetical protein
VRNRADELRGQAMKLGAERRAARNEAITEELAVRPAWLEQTLGRSRTTGTTEMTGTGLRARSLRTGSTTTSPTRTPPSTRGNRTAPLRARSPTLARRSAWIRPAAVKGSATSIRTRVVPT